MAKPKADTVGSYKQHKELMFFDVDHRYRETEHHLRWKCSCGAHGSWVPDGPFRRASLPRLWADHVQRKHPDYEM